MSKHYRRKSSGELQLMNHHEAAGRCAELPALPFVWPWHTALKQSALTFDFVITDLLRGVGGGPPC